MTSHQRWAKASSTTIGLSKADALLVRYKFASNPQFKVARFRHQHDPTELPAMENYAHNLNFGNQPSGAQHHPPDVDALAADLAQVQLQTPPWFEHAIRPYLAAIEKSLADIRTTAALAYNYQCLIGCVRTYKVVPFPNGQLPPNSLPAITSSIALRDMSDEHVIAYYRGYCDPHGPCPEREEMIQKTLIKIGGWPHKF
ncbi:hypothetical protein BOTBODRAFT_35140 [Botryobasidium botryosum FD-172 SS1]|uniref:Mug135-like C-terminal domain-containing protein n=1 Tax=Botryobasidium botryosum (strain FD-172 SS1) TaxID=930990 RepID=A0A067MII6_BOTB1|nr:hypothetical protein BOTBODRAFT_35140 [Botryobasidium botryosum FD-172 SS1]